MEVSRGIARRGHTAALTIRAVFDARELQLIERFGLGDYAIQVRDGTLRGKRFLSSNDKRAHRAHLNRVKSRWNVSLIPTSRLVALDHLGHAGNFCMTQIRTLAGSIVGRRYRLSDAIAGITIRSGQIRHLREAELAILTSLAAVSKAIDYAGRADDERMIPAAHLLAELDGLDFAGAGDDIDDAPGRMGCIAAFLVLALIVLAAIAAMQQLAGRLATTFDQVAVPTTSPGDR